MSHINTELKIPSSFLDKDSGNPMLFSECDEETQAKLALDARFEKWDWWDQSSGNLMPGLVKSYNALCGMKRAWAVEPGRSRVLDRITMIINITDPETDLLLYLVANKCLAQARYLLGEFDVSLEIIIKVLLIVRPENLTCPKIKVEIDALNTLQRILKRPLLPPLPSSPTSSPTSSPASSPTSSRSA
jgi:hypothetical protein